MNNKLYDALEICLQAIENGASVDSVLARFPDLAADLRPILEASRRAREIPAPLPSADVMRRGRASLLQHAAEMRESKRPARRRQSVIPFFQRLTIALTLAAAALMSGTGLVQASSTSLPGENLYPVKRTWEDMRLLFVFSPEQREAVESEYEVERLDEVAELLREGRVVSITFTGLVTESTADSMVVSGVPVALTAQTAYSGDPLTVGTSVIVTGQTDSVGHVSAISVQVLPPGTMVPTGEHEEDDQAPDQNKRSGTFHIEGTVQTIDGSVWVIDGQTVYVENPALQTLIQVGTRVEVKGYFSTDGRFIVTRVEVKDSESEHDGSTPKNNSDSSNDNSNTNENSNDENNNANDNDNQNNDNSDNENDNLNDNGNDENDNGDNEENDNSNENLNNNDNPDDNEKDNSNDKNRNENDNSEDGDNENNNDNND
jgi:hypothetical protein